MGGGRERERQRESWRLFLFTLKKLFTAVRINLVKGGDRHSINAYFEGLCYSLLLASTIKCNKKLCKDECMSVC